jgi:hypothetical protein
MLNTINAILYYKKALLLWLEIFKPLKSNAEVVVTPQKIKMAIWTLIMLSAFPCIGIYKSTKVQYYQTKALQTPC